MQLPNFENKRITFDTDHKKTISVLAALNQPATTMTAMAEHLMDLGVATFLAGLTDEQKKQVDFISQSQETNK